MSVFHTHIRKMPLLSADLAEGSGDCLYREIGLRVVDEVEEDGVLLAIVDVRERVVVPERAGDFEVGFRREDRSDGWRVERAKRQLRFRLKRDSGSYVL